ncbi:putative U box domain, armadillo-like helical, Zinc finger, RING/FYVE/PHD-type [Helianthus annuus]|nr:putative U box domain, armadillo-like helical, Zinc finger, RING/FYVE/PHD-type [Helianthus annuus]
MAGVDSTNAVRAAVHSLLRLVRDVGRTSSAGFAGEFKKDCTDLARRVTLLSHLLEEIRDFKVFDTSSFSSAWLPDLTVAVQAAKKLLAVAGSFDRNVSPDGAAMKIEFQFHGVTLKLEKALANLPYDHFDISEEVQEQVDLVRGQLRRARERYSKPQNSTSDEEDLHLAETNTNINDQEAETKVQAASKENLSEGCNQNETVYQLETSKNSSETSSLLDENKKPDAPVIPVDFLCPISLELMRDPVIVSTGQTYERSYIQRWIDCGNTTCPKTQQKLQNVILTPNYVLRSLITQWCINNNMEQPNSLTNRRLKRSDGSFRDVSEDIEAIELLIRNLSSQSIDERRSALTQIRSLSKRSTDNRILLAEAGAIPILVKNGSTRGKKDAATALFNLCIYQGNKGRAVRAGIIPVLLRMLSDSSSCMVDESLTILSILASHQEAKSAIVKASTIPLLIDLTRTGPTRNKENATSILLSLCKRDKDNLDCISRLGAVIPLMELAKNGSERAKRKARSLLEHLQRFQQV